MARGSEKGGEEKGLLTNEAASARGQASRRAFKPSACYLSISAGSATSQSRKKTMPTLSNGSELSVFEDTENPNTSPDAILLTHHRNRWRRDRADRGKGGFSRMAGSTWPRSTSSTASSPSPASPTRAGPRPGRRWKRRSSTMRAISSAPSPTRRPTCRPQIVSINASSPDDITVTWTGANEYFGGENTQYGEHQIILEGGALQPDTFVNHEPTVTDLESDAVARRGPDR